MLEHWIVSALEVDIDINLVLHRGLERDQVIVLTEERWLLHNDAFMGSLFQCYICAPKKNN